LSQRILGFVAVILLVAAGGLWVTPKLQEFRTSRRPAPTGADGSPPAAVLLLLALGVSALAAAMAIIGLVMGG
jgi:hypothetical protein